MFQVAEDLHEKSSLIFDVSSESSARQRIHMKNQALFSSKHKSKKLKCRLLQFLFGALRVNHTFSLLLLYIKSSMLTFLSASNGSVFAYNVSENVMYGLLTTSLWNTEP